MEKEIPIHLLVESENRFLQLCMPSYSVEAKELIKLDCCEHHCSLFLRRIDILLARFEYVKFYERMDEPGKRDARYLFISTMYRRCKDTFKIISISDNTQVCPILISHVFGFSYNVLMNGLLDPPLNLHKSRPWYQPTVEALSSAMLTLSKVVQFNSLGKIMLPPNYGSRMPSQNAVCIPVKEVAKRMNLPLQVRKIDSLTRCNACSALSLRMGDHAHSLEDRAKACEHLKLHHDTISQQRTIVDCLYQQSRDPDIDLVVIVTDAMSNRVSKLPALVSRPKCIGDGDRICMNLTTLQIAECSGTQKFKNLEYPTLQGLFSHDANYNLSLLLDSIWKLAYIPSTLYVICDSARNNKSFLTFGGIGYILTKIHNLKQVVFLFPSVGHTHNSCDAHFGVLSKAMVQRDLFDPLDFSDFLKSMPSVHTVEHTPTIFDFRELTQYMNQPTGLCSNGQIIVAKSFDGSIYFSSSATMNSTLLFGAECNRTALPLFKKEFYKAEIIPKIRRPDEEAVRPKLESLMKSGGSVFKKTNKENYLRSMEQFGKKSFRSIVSEINSKPRKVRISTISENQDPNSTVLKYLEECGISVGRLPKAPQIL